MPSRSPFTILVRMPNWLGDCVMAMPAVRHLADSLPDARVYLAGRGQFRKLFLAQPGVAGFVEAPASGLGKLVKGMSNTRRLVREAGLPGGSDLGILFTNSLSTAAWMWRAGARRRLGYNVDCRRVFLTHPVPCGGVEKSLHFIRYYMWLVKSAETALQETGTVVGRQLEPLEGYLIPKLAVAEDARTEAAGLLEARGIYGRYAVLAPASAYGAVKDWPPAHYRDLAARIVREFSLPVVVTGGAGQAGVCQAIADGLKSTVSVAGETALDSFAGLLAGASLFVGGDSGGAHTAAALGIPTLVIFGITNPGRTQPTGVRVRMLGQGEERDVKLSTPEAREAAKKALAAISPDMAMSAIRELLS